MSRRSPPIPWSATVLVADTERPYPARLLLPGGFLVNRLGIDSDRAQLLEHPERVGHVPLLDDLAALDAPDCYAGPPDRPVRWEHEPAENPLLVLAVRASEHSELRF